MPLEDQPTDEFVHVPLTIPVLRRVRMILNAAAPENKRLRARRNHDPDGALPRCNT
jgi:hypothetical protein